MNESGTCCLVCGCMEVVKDKGFFYCLECQTQREGLRDQVFEIDDECNEENNDIFGSRNIAVETSLLRRRRPKRNKVPKKKGDDFTSWEMFNFVLRGQVEELVALGAPSSFKITVLQLWSYYLHKLEVAFVSQEENILPKLYFKYRNKDAELIYGVKKNKKEKQKKETKANFNLDSSILESNDWSSLQLKKKLNNKRKKAMLAEAVEKSIISTESCILDESNAFDSSLNCVGDENLVDNSDDVAVDPQEIQLNSGTREMIERGYNMKANRFSMLQISRYRLILLLYLALLYERVDIYISDIIRWVREGHLSFYDVAHFLPENCFLHGVDSTCFQLTASLLPYDSFLQKSSLLGAYLGMNYWPAPDVKKIAKKYVKELQLPKIFCDLILEVFLLDSNSFNSVSVKGVIPNYEGRVLAVLIIIMKLLLGLDGKTEHKLSKAASTLNKWLHHKKDKKRKKLFVWNDWVKQIICRNAVLTQHHFPTKHLICPETYGNPDLFINFWKKQNKTREKSKEKFIHRENSCIKDTEPALVNFFNNVLDKLEDLDYLRKVDLDFPPCSTPWNLYTKKILEKCSEEDSLITPEAQKILSEDFSNCDISYLLTPSKMNKVVEKHDHCLKVITKSAQKKFCTFKQKKKEVLYAYRTIGSCKCNIAVTHCHRNHMNKYRYVGKKVFVDHREEKRRKAAKSIQELLDRARLSLTGTKRKSKKIGSGSKAKKRKKEVLKIKAKTLKLYIPFTEYWVLHFDNISREQFEKEVIFKFPFAFSWFLSECALMSEMSKWTLYKEVIFMENYFKNNLLNVETAK